MSRSETGSGPDADTLEHLLGVVNESREKRCAEVKERANEEARDIVRQAYARTRARLHRHVIALREKYRVRVASASARNQTLLRKQHQKKDLAMLDEAWPLLREAMLEQWSSKDSRAGWLDAAIDHAASMLLDRRWQIEHPADLDTRDLEMIRQISKSKQGKEPKLRVDEDIEAGIRISTHGTVVDASIDGLLKQRGLIEAQIIARVKQSGGGDD